MRAYTFDELASMVPSGSAEFVRYQDALAAIEQARREEREAWRGRAAQWLHDRARAQECTNIEYPSHAASYPNWSAIVSHADQFAFELERELAAILARKP